MGEFHKNGLFPDRKKAAPPFTVSKPLSSGDRTINVLDAAGETFCVVHVGHCIGGDHSGATSRARRIAEALNAVAGAERREIEVSTQPMPETPMPEHP